jgi:ABC-type multidrug transport system fused ATPase/permease subunit
MDICMGAGIHPFRVKTDDEVAKFEETCNNWIQNAALITTDFVQLNQGILNGEIDLYFTGGTYTTAAARLEGVTELYAITPNSGPADGKGGINWIEINSAVANPDLHPNAFDWLEFITTVDAAELVARGNGNLQPVSQMANPELMSRFSAEELAAIQWDEFDQRIANAVEFDIVPDYDRLYDIYSAAMRAAGMTADAACKTSRPVILSLAGLTKTFGETRAVAGVSLDIPEGEFLTIVGPSGSGKSTLVRLLAGLEAPTGGRLIALRGRRTSRRSPRTGGRPRWCSSRWRSSTTRRWARTSNSP